MRSALSARAGVAPAALRLLQLTLTDFRNYPDMRLSTEASAMAITGPNGAGKTNLLEAISMLGTGRALRSAAFPALARLGGSGGWAVAAQMATGDDRIRLATSWAPGPNDEAGSGTRRISIDGVVQKGPGVLDAHINLLWLTPAMDRLFAGPAGDRRRFLDRLTGALDRAHMARVADFERLMRERNLVLSHTSPDRVWLGGIEAQMAERASAVAAARIHAVDGLQHHIDATPDDPYFPRAILSLEGEFEAALRARPAVQVEDEYRIGLSDSRGLDRAAGRTLRGPHRCDLAVTHAPKSMPAALCSTGEQKALLIGLILAQSALIKAQRGIAPLLLLDEVAAHLDRGRRRGLFDTLDHLGSQAWMTGTDRDLFADLGTRADHIEVDAAHIKRIS